jgi:transcriptional regulator with XRE-family HTH domain
MDSQLAGTLARVLRTERAARGWTQAELAEAVGLAVEAYGRLERGGILPRAQSLVRLSRVLQVSTDALLGLTLSPRDSSPRSPLAALPPALQPERPDVRRLSRRLRAARPRTIRLLGLLLTELER